METTEIRTEWEDESLYFKLKKQFFDKDVEYPLPKDIDLERYYEAGVIRKSDLEDGIDYIGLCRNSSVARWDAKNEQFWYLRFKFGERFAEPINTIEDDNGYDLFVPLRKLSV